jgi:hypothetical protein
LHDNKIEIWGKPVKDAHKLIVGNYEDILFPVLFKQAYGKKICDIIDTGWPSLYLISDKLIDIFEKNNFTGWKLFPVKILDKKGNVIEGYHGFSVTGICGPIDYSKCTIVEKRFVPNGTLNKYYQGLYIGLDKWDGSDFFLPEKYYGIIVTQRVAEITQIHMPTNVEFKNLSTIETADYGIPKT